MPFDIVFPENNEKELVAMAKELGTTELLLLYPVGKLPTLPDLGMNVKVGVITSPTDIDEVRNKADVVALRSSDNDRVFFERADAPKLLLGLGENQREDRTHQRESGLNQPLLRDIARRGAAVVISVDSLLRAEGASRAILIGRWMQNVMLVRKMGVRVIIASCASSPFGLRSAHDRQSLGIILGMHPSEAKEAVSRLM